MTDTYTSADLATVIPEVWGSKINDYFKSDLVIAPFFIDRSSELMSGGDVLHTPGMVAMSVNTKTNGAAVTLNSPANTTVDLTVDQWKEVSFAIEDREAAQVLRSYAIMDKLAANAGYEIASALEVALASLFSGFSTTVGSSTTNVADSDLRSAIATLTSANAVNNRMDNIAWFLHQNVFWNQIQGIDKFSLAINAPVQDPAAKIPAYKLYGIPVYLTSKVQYVSGSTGFRNALVHTDAIHFATSPLGFGGSKGAKVGSSGVRVQTNYIPDYLSTITTADILYGTVMNRSNAGVQVLSKA